MTFSEAQVAVGVDVLTGMTGKTVRTALETAEVPVRAEKIAIVERWAGAEEKTKVG